MSVITTDPEIRNGQPCVDGTRITVNEIVRWTNAGETVEDLMREYGLTPEHIEAALVYNDLKVGKDEDALLATHIPMKDWGKDHWSTLLYIETRFVDHKGKLNDRHMRKRDERYPTRLRGNSEDNPRVIEMHSDYDCIDDMVVAGVASWDTAFLDKIELTPYGHLVAAALRRHRARGGAVASFWPEDDVRDFLYAITAGAREKGLLP